MEEITGWEAKRAGPGITLTGWTDAPTKVGPPRVRTKIPGIRRIFSEDGLVKAEGKDGAVYRLA